MSMIESLPTESELTAPPVTLCPPGKRSRDIVARERPESAIPLILSTALASPVKPSIVPPARNDRRPAQERVEAALRADAVSVALAQPHRAGNDDPLAGSALGRYCLRQWPGAARRDFREGRAEAGNRFAQDVDNDRVARGLAPRMFGEASGTGALTDDQLRARREACARARADAESEIRSVHQRAVSVLTDLCWRDMEPGQYDDDVIMHALYRLARHYGLEKRAFHED